MHVEIMAERAIVAEVAAVPVNPRRGGRRAAHHAGRDDERRQYSLLQGSVISLSYSRSVSS